MSQPAEEGPRGPEAAPHVVGLDGGGTRTRIAVADLSGRELVRRLGPAGLIDPVDPAQTATTLIELVRAAAHEAGVPLPFRALCAGLAGAGLATARVPVQEALLAAGVADRVEVVSDGRIALEGALAGQAGVLLIAGTGSIAFGRSESGEVQRCGGWGHLVGDEGSGYTIARAGLKAALQAADGRGEPTRLLSELLARLGLEAPREIPAWVAHTEKGDVAALAPDVGRLANAGDAAARRIIDAAARDLSHHVEALLSRLGPWSRPVPVVFLGGALKSPAISDRVRALLQEMPYELAFVDAVDDAVSGAVRMALQS